jgi:hypothetical protein
MQFLRILRKSAFFCSLILLIACSNSAQAHTGWALDPQAQKQAKLLTEATRAGDYNRVQSLLQQGVDVNGHTGDKMVPGETAIIFAARAGSLELVELLLAWGACPNACAWREWPHAGSPVLRYALDGGSLAVVCRLIQAGARVDASTESGINQSVQNVTLLGYAIKEHMPLNLICALLAGGNPKTLANQAVGCASANWTPPYIPTRIN